MRIVALRNPESSRNRGKPPPRIPEVVRAIDLNGVPSLDETLNALRAEGLDLLVLDGGDGTIREVVSRLPEIFGPDMPMLAVIASGNTNLVARKYGSVPSYDHLSTLSALAPSALSGRSRTIPLLTIRGLDDTVIRGFIAGWGAYATGTRIAIEEISARGGRQVVRAVLSVLRRALFGAEAGDLRRGIDMRLSFDNAPPASAKRFAGIATVIEGSLVSGLTPFWGTGSGPIRWLDIDAPARRLWLAAPFVALGKPWAWMGRAGYRSGRSERLDLTLAGDIVVDGEVFPCNDERPLIISAEDHIRLVSL